VAQHTLLIDQYNNSWAPLRWPIADDLSNGFYGF